MRRKYFYIEKDKKGRIKKVKYQTKLDDDYITFTDEIFKAKKDDYRCIGEDCKKKLKKGDLIFRWAMFDDYNIIDKRGILCSKCSLEFFREHKLMKIYNQFKEDYSKELIIGEL